MIKFFESTDAGAPTLNNAVGSMIAVLDACLITGYNSKSITSITVASGVATVVCTAHAYANTYGKKIRIAGATGSFTALNKDTDIANVTTNGFTFLCPGVADGAATGTLTAKYAPLDWVKQYSGTNKAMYKRSDVTATGCMLRIDDTLLGQYARVVMVESATDVDTYTNHSPTTAQMTDAFGQYWMKGYNTASAANWALISDGLFFYLFTLAGTSYTHYVTHLFGDVPSFKPGDSLNCVIGGGIQSNGNSTPLYGSPTAQSFVIAGGKNGVTKSQPVMPYAKNNSYGVNDANVYPSDVDGGLVISYPVLMPESANNGHIRGVVPGLAIPLALINAVLLSKTRINNIIGNSREFMVFSIGSTAPSSTAQVVALIDLTGPWR